jgi:16S rRNA (guanine1207-N2)-methyltransferase
MVDINERALALARENAELNHSSHVSILKSDGFSAVSGMFEIIVTNPPVRAGKQTVFAFFEGSFDHLTEGGLFYTVLQKKQGAPSAFKKLTELFGACAVLRKEGGYWIMCAVRAGVGKNE